MRFNWRDLARALLDSIMPPRSSERIVRGLSIGELASLAHTGEAHAGRHSFSYLLPYRDKQVTALIWELKYRRNARAISLATALLAEEITALASEALAPPLLIPIPMHSARLHERGHNQTELLGAAVAAECAGICEYAPRALMRVRHTPPQQGQPRSKRLSNVRDSMRAMDPSLVEGRACIVIDDVATTGATMQEARRALRVAGADAVYCLALAG